MEIIDASDETSLLAVQGPSAASIIANYTTYDLDTLRMFNFDDIDLLDLLAYRLKKWVIRRRWL